MGFKIDGTEWSPETTAEHAKKWLDEINALLEENDIKDKDGNVISLSANFANALYLQILAGSSRLAENDEKLQQAINSFNVELCDDQQIENLLPIAAMTRNPGSYSRVNLTVTASEDGACTVPAGTRAPFGDYFFVTQEEAVITAGASANVMAVCNVVGPIVALAGEINTFETQIANLESVTNAVSSVPGTSQESTNELRQRLIVGDTIKYSINGCKTALEELTGVIYARVYFNYNVSSSIELPGGVELAPRTAYIVIHGESDKIAEVYCEYMNAPTQNGDNPELAKSQDFITNSGQAFEIKYDDAAEQDIYVKVVVDAGATLDDQVESQIQRDLIKSSADWEIGQAISSLITSVPFKDCTYTTVAYTQISTDGETWENIISVGCNVIPRLKSSNIIVEQVE